MGSRQSVYVSTFVKAPTPPSPNRTIAGVTVDLRVFYPPTVDGLNIAVEALTNAYIEATEELQARQRRSASAGGSEGSCSPPEEG